jgi:hypothetical protein
MADSANRLQIERDFAQAKRLGRWLSDEEALSAAETEARLRQRQQEIERNRGKLWALTLICLIIPPLWPLALGLSLYLLFPLTTRRFVVAAGLGLTLLVLLSAGALAAFLVWLWMLFG